MGGKHLSKIGLICQIHFGKTRLINYAALCYQTIRFYRNSKFARSGTLADLGGRARHAPPPPTGPDFFRFDMQNFWNIATSGVHGPPYEVHDPPTGNPGSATVVDLPNQLWWAGRLKFTYFYINTYLSQ